MKKIWSVYEVGATYEGPLTEIEASSEKSALDNTADHFGVSRKKLYAVPGALLTGKPGRSHSTKRDASTERVSDREFAQAARFEGKKYGLTQEEALRFVKHPRFLSIRRDVESWREQHGFPAPNSALTRGYLLDKLKDETARLWGYRR